MLPTTKIINNKNLVPEAKHSAVPKKCCRVCNDDNLGNYCCVPFKIKFIF